MNTATAGESDGKVSAPAVAHRTERLDRIGYLAALVAATLPILVAAIRIGRSGWTPTYDVATTVVRSRAVFSRHPPLVGMWSAASGWSGGDLHFPGALQLYLLAVPVHLLGNTWGPLLGMATLNIAWVLTAGWLLRRRLGTRGAAVALVFVTLLIWSVGGNILVDITPMQMVTIPYALFLIAVWSVADGDIQSLPVLVFIANFLVLDHLVLTFLVPVIGLCAPIGLAQFLHQKRRADPDGHALRVRRLKRSLLISAGLTLILWLPPLYQQFTAPQGNLTALWSASSASRPNQFSHVQAFKTVVSLIARPPFWLRPTISNGRLGFGASLASTSAFGFGLLLVIVALVVAAVRRRDRTTVTLLAVASVSAIAMIENIRQAPAQLGFPRGYLRSMWGMAMFVWLAIAVAVFRALPVRPKSLMARAAVPASVLVSLLALPAAPFDRRPFPEPYSLTTEMISAVIPQLPSNGPLYLAWASPEVSMEIGPAFLLGLETAGIPYCVTHGESFQYGKEHDCGGQATAEVRISNGSNKQAFGGTILFQKSFLTSEDQRELERLDNRVGTWLGSLDHLTYQPWIHEILASAFPASIASIDANLVRPGGNLEHLLEDHSFGATIRAYSPIAGRSSPRPMFDGQTMDPATLLRWAELKGAQFQYGNLTVVMLSQRPNG